MKKLLEKFYVDERDKFVKSISRQVGGLYNAEDVVQEAFSRALKHIGTFNPERGQMGAWFYRILNNAKRDFWKQERLGGAVEFDENEVDPIPMEVIDSRLSESMRKEIEVMKSPAKDVLELFFIKGYSIPDISQITDVSKHSIRTYWIPNFKRFMEGKYGKS